MDPETEDEVADVLEFGRWTTACGSVVALLELEFAVVGIDAGGSGRFQMPSFTHDSHASCTPWFQSLRKFVKRCWAAQSRAGLATFHLPVVAID